VPGPLAQLGGGIGYADPGKREATMMVMAVNRGQATILDQDGGAETGRSPSGGESGSDMG